MRTGMRMGSIVLLVSMIATVSAADWPQWRGSKHDAKSSETGLLKTWPKAGPTLLWTFRDAGMGYTSPAVVGEVIYTMGARGDQEVVIAIDKTGKELWTARIGPVFDFKSNTWSRGPNGTPCVEGKLLFAVGSQGELVCVETDTGKVVWHKNLPKEMAGEVNNIFGSDDTAKMGWGYSWSPFVDGDNLICIPGGPQGLFAALDKKTGAVKWRSADVKDAATYASPIPAEIAGVKQYIALVQNGLVSVAAKDGSLLWAFRNDSDYPDVVCPTPLVSGDMIYVGVGNGGGSMLVKVTKDGSVFKANSVYSKKEIGNRQGGLVLVDGLIYGAHEDRAWNCQDLATGAIKWTSNRRAIGIGPVVYADGRLYAVSEGNGEVAMFDAAAEKTKEVSRFKLPEESKLRKVRGKIWSHPVIADGKLYLRDQELVFCYAIK